LAESPETPTQSKQDQSRPKLQLPNFMNKSKYQKAQERASILNALKKQLPNGKSVIVYAIDKLASHYYISDLPASCVTSEKLGEIAANFLHYYEKIRHQPEFCTKGAMAIIELAARTSQQVMNDNNNLIIIVEQRSFHGLLVQIALAVIPASDEEMTACLISDGTVNTFRIQQMLANKRRDADLKSAA
jgi:hypothetical protein